MGMVWGGGRIDPPVFTGGLLGIRQKAPGENPGISAQPASFGCAAPSLSVGRSGRPLWGVDQPHVVEPHELQDRGVQVVHVHLVLHDPQARLVGEPDDTAAAPQVPQVSSAAATGLSIVVRRVVLVRIRVLGGVVV
jgi:hypothetical protein